MCLETMDTKSNQMKPDFLRKAVTLGPKWRQIRVSGEVDRAFKPDRARMVKRTTPRRRQLHRGQKRAQLAALAKALEDLRETPKRGSMYEEAKTVEAYMHSHPGSMAPENTTQYLMGNVYEDMRTNVEPHYVATPAHLYGDCLSPRGVSAALDSCYESCLSFQQRDFEEVFSLA